MFTLDAEFEKSNGKHHHLRLSDFDLTKTAEEIKSSLEKLTKLNLFEKEGTGLFKKVLHATVIEKKVTTIFDDSKKKKKRGKDPLSQLMEAASHSVVEPAAVKQVPVLEPESVKTVVDLATLRIPQDLRITEERIEPDRLIQTIELPRGIDPWKMNESQAFGLVVACMPAKAKLINVEVDDKSIPARLIVTESVAESGLPPELPVNTKSPPEKPKKKRTRLLDRIRKRE
ncbi:DUF2922 domain-containing protein [Enterococcus malodoratus]|uniref:DUF2922 domain-containing protein n=1 Tax=Enterococcus malodoratus TaxID=71451 RepID=UPI0020730BD3|nr:DUF2922 domain-containing protein [Enterococcus malodoratus]